MFLELIGTVFAGLAFAGIALVLNKLTGGASAQMDHPCRCWPRHDRHDDHQRILLV